METNFVIFGLGKPSQEVSMAALAIVEGRIIHTCAWGKQSSFRTMLHSKIKQMQKSYGPIAIASVQVTPNLFCVGGGLTLPEAKCKVQAYLTPERTHDLATNAEARYRSTSSEAQGSRNDADADARAAEI